MGKDIVQDKARSSKPLDEHLHTQLHDVSQVHVSNPIFLN